MSPSRSRSFARHYQGCSQAEVRSGCRLEAFSYTKHVEGSGSEPAVRFHRVLDFWSHDGPVYRKRGCYGHFGGPSRVIELPFRIFGCFLRSSAFQSHKASRQNRLTLALVFWMFCKPLSLVLPLNEIENHAPTSVKKFFFKNNDVKL